MNVEVKKLTPELIEPFLHFFDHVAFQDNPKWASCYCFFYSRTWADGEWSERTGEDNRRDVAQWIASSGMNGYLAFLDGQPVGWCHANSMANVASFLSEHEKAPEQTGLLLCFLIAPAHRKKGIAKRLLQTACDQFHADGFAKVQARPKKNGSTEQDNYHGPLAMYLDQGFEIVQELEHQYIVQKVLSK